MKQRENMRQRSWSDYEGSNPIKRYENTSFYKDSERYGPLAKDRVAQTKVMDDREFIDGDNRADRGGMPFGESLRILNMLGGASAQEQSSGESRGRRSDLSDRMQQIAANAYAEALDEVREERNKPPRSKKRKDNVTDEDEDEDDDALAGAKGY